MTAILTVPQQPGPVLDAQPEPAPEAPVYESYRVVDHVDDGIPVTASVYSKDRRWSYMRMFDTLGQPLRVSFHPDGAKDGKPSPLRVDYRYPYRSLESVLVNEVAAGRTAVAIRALAVKLLADPDTSPADVAVAVRAVVELDVITAWCVCGGYLWQGPDRVWEHVNVCRWCLHNPDACTPQARAGHPTCTRPEPRQCEHQQCRASNDYTATLGCGMDKVCCGAHECDTAVTA